VGLISDDRLFSGGLQSPTVERPETKVGGRGVYLNARDFIDNAWSNPRSEYNFNGNGDRKVSFKLKEGPYQDYVIITWRSEKDLENGEVDEQTMDVYIIAELWDGWEEIFRSKPYQVNRVSDEMPCFLSQLNLTTVDIEAFFGLCFCTRL
jgi:hypothetical protein